MMKQKPKRPARPFSLTALHREASGRLRHELHSRKHIEVDLSTTEHLILEAEKRVRRKIWLRKNLPLHLVLLLPGLAFVGTRSRTVLALLVVTSPLLLVVRALLSRLLSVWVGSEEESLRHEIQRLRTKREASLEEDSNHPRAR